MNGKAASAYGWVLALCLLVITVSLVFLRPFWGLMDDAGLLYDLIPRMENNGIFLESWKYAVADMAWGMFRPIYPLMAYLIYKPGMMTAPWVSYAINAVFCIALLVGMAIFWARRLKLNWREILLVNACFPYQYDLLQHLSLQEKLVLLAAWFLLWSAAYFPRKWLFPTFGILTVIGFLTKASFIIYFGPAWVVLLNRVWGELKGRNSSSYFGVSLAALLGLIAVVLLGKIARQGGYTAQYDFAKVWPNLISPHSALLLLPLGLGTYIFGRSWRSVLSSPEVIAPWLGVALFLVLFLPWGVNGYLQSVIGPLVSVLICQIVAFCLVAPRWKTYFFSGVCALAIGICVYRVPTMFLRLRDISQIVAAGNSFASESLNMPCQEGSESMRRFLVASGLPGAQVKFQPILPTDMSGIWLYDSKMCPLPERVMAPLGCSQEFLYQPFWEKSYRVVRLRCTPINS